MSASSSTSIGVFGFGAFARLMTPHLAPRFRLVVHDPCERAQGAARAAGLRTVSVEEAARSDVIALAAPLSALADCLRPLSGLVTAGQTVLDVCSVKEAPARLMQDLLPPGVDILATHPMFGPRSARDGLAGHRIVLCPIRGRNWRRIAAFLRRDLKLDVIVTTPEEHDRQAALSQGLTHLLARAVETLGTAPAIRTPSFDRLMEALDMVRDDSAGVFDAVTRDNPHVAPMRRKLIEALRTGRG